MKKVALILAILLTANSLSICQTTKKYSEKSLTLVYIGTSTCPACGSDLNKKSFNKIVKRLTKKVPNQDIRIIGVALDEEPKTGYQHLTNLSSTFDEMIIGGETMNLGSLRFLRNKFPGRIFVPQILLLLRTYNTNSDSSVNTSIEKEELLHRVLGVNKMTKFATLLNDINFNKYISE